MHRYKITCKNCKKSDVVTIDEKAKRIMDFAGKMLTPLTAGRWRADASWGWECVCGNYDLLAESERKDFDSLVSGSPMRVMQISKMLERPVKNRFVMESV